MDLTQYRAGEKEKARIADLLAMIPSNGGTVLDIGARDGFISLLLAERFSEVTALDLDRPRVEHPAIKCVKGNLCALDFDDNAFDVVLCAEVLEHIPPAFLSAACTEIVRVSKRCVVIGVPYRQDNRIGRTTCHACGQVNPPWGHINVFDEAVLRGLFSEPLIWDKTSFVGINRASTNALSTMFMDWAGNPHGTYDQEEPCMTCGSRMVRPTSLTVLKNLAALSALMAYKVQSKFVLPRPKWIHVRFFKDRHECHTKLKAPECSRGRLTMPSGSFITMDLSE